jgi:hypothetical protein
MARRLSKRLCITKTPSGGFPSNVTLLLPGRPLNPASSSLPHVADFNGIRHGWDLRDPQSEMTVYRARSKANVEKRLGESAVGSLCRRESDCRQPVSRGPVRLFSNQELLLLTITLREFWGQRDWLAEQPPIPAACTRWARFMRLCHLVASGPVTVACVVGESGE